ncbi:ATP-dependent DNA/RNA helicase DHX36 [Lepeophtheirus salmonis]|uniref:ATP-dependent DNA/RNA helicase DHX36 n=1 Tax=Lepeophtheirus salmonis TaxID=72036 RepID=UPI001AE295F8|nr:ATP-dependent DNA/RNA helicase DHX36-like [Lepeophtheirus salmonis]
MERRGRHPEGLRGRDIGLYYAKKNKEKGGIQLDEIVLSNEVRQKIEDWRKKHGSSGRSAPKMNTEFHDRYNAHLKKSQYVVDNWGEDSDAEEEQVEEEEEEGEEEEEEFPVSKRCPKTDESLLEKQMDEKENPSSELKDIFHFRELLPAWTKKENILEMIEKNQVVVISGETGCGKTTQVPQFILDHSIAKGEGSLTNIICTQPRRISAVSVAERVAYERGEHSCGNSVGYQIRLESKLPRSKGSIIFCTTGIPLQWMRRNPLLNGISHIILDEIHERDILSDFLITLLKDILIQRKDLKVILMSATLNAQQFARYFDGCPIVEIPGRIFPVEEHFLEDVLEMTNFPISYSVEYSGSYKKRQNTAKKANRENGEYIRLFSQFLRNIEPKFSDSTMESLSTCQSEQFNPELIANLVQYIHTKKPEGAILIFLSGWNEISKVHELFTGDSEYSRINGLRIHPLHSLMPTVNQKEIFERPPKNIRKVILATNIAETSITIDDIVYVIDSGKIKIKDFDKEMDVDTLKPRWISLANARQRKGRAGRVKPGICYRLYSSYRESTFESYLKPEILRTRLDEVILNIKVLGLGPAASFLAKMMESPNPESVEHAISFLQNIRALQNNEELTHLGFHLAELPMSPQTGKMVLLGAIFSCLDPVLSIAASLNFKDPFIVPLGQDFLAKKKKNALSKGSNSDHLTLSNVMAEWDRVYDRGQFCWKNYLSKSNVKMLDNLKCQFAEYLYEKKFIKSKNVKDKDANINSENLDLIRSIVAAGLYPNVAKITKQKGPMSVMCTSKIRRISFHSKSVLSTHFSDPSRWIVYNLMLKGESSTSILDGTVVPSLALALWGKEKDTSNEGQLIFDNILRFSLSHSDMNDLMTVKRALNQFIEDRMSHPVPVDWNNTTSFEGSLLKLLLHLMMDPYCRTARYS